jgi:hypothetical protein
VALGLLTPNLMGFGGLRAHTRVMPICGIPPLDFGLSFARAGAVILAASGSMRGFRRDDKPRRSSKTHFNGIDGSITHISIVSISLSLGTLWNGLSFPARAEAVSLPLAPKRWQVDKEIAVSSNAFLAEAIR